MIAEVYALNVMPWAIASFLGCSIRNKELIEMCREDLLDFLTEKEKEGTIFPNQDWAWNQYKEWQILFSTPDEFDHLDLDEAEVLDMSWTEEIAKILEDALVKGNYNEFGGQL